MPDVGRIVAALQQTMEAVAAAQAAALQVEARARQVQSRAAGSGFRGVAERVGAAMSRLNQIGELQAGVATTAREAAGTVQRVIDEMTPADVVSTLSPASQQMGSASAKAGAASVEVDRLKAEITAALRGGRPGPLVSLVDQIKRALTRAVGSLGVANTATDEIIEAALQTGNFWSGMAATPVRRRHPQTQPIERPTPAKPMAAQPAGRAAAPRTKQAAGLPVRAATSRQFRSGSRNWQRPCGTRPRIKRSGGWRYRTANVSGTRSCPGGSAQPPTSKVSGKI
jgi:hypothetical protein